MKAFTTIASKILSPMRAKCVLIFFMVSLGLVTGCKSTQPVSSNTVKENSKDSLSTWFVGIVDTSSFKETVTRKELPGATIGISTTKEQLDSLISALGNLPSSVTRTVYYTDPKLKAQLSIALDSLGRISMKCQALDQVYYEKFTQQTRYIKSLESKLSEVNKENKLLKETTVEKKKKGLRAILDNTLAAVLIFFIMMGIVVVIIREGFKILRKDGNT